MTDAIYRKWNDKIILICGFNVYVTREMNLTFIAKVLFYISFYVIFCWPKTYLVRHLILKSVLFGLISYDQYTNEEGKTGWFLVMNEPTSVISVHGNIKWVRMRRLTVCILKASIITETYKTTLFSVDILRCSGKIHWQQTVWVKEWFSQHRMLKNS